MRAAIQGVAYRGRKFHRQVVSIQSEDDRANDTNRGASRDCGKTREGNEQTESCTNPKKERLRGIAHRRRKSTGKQQGKTAQSPSCRVAHDSILPRIFAGRDDCGQVLSHHKGGEESGAGGHGVDEDMLVLGVRAVANGAEAIERWDA
jgi:hypothetical protein